MRLCLLHDMRLVPRHVEQPVDWQRDAGIDMHSCPIQLLWQRGGSSQCGPCPLGWVSDARCRDAFTARALSATVSC